MSIKKNIKQIIKIILVVALIANILNFLQIPEIIECERLTQKYGKLFTNPELYGKPAHTENIIDLKVLEYMPFEAKVHYICEHSVSEEQKFSGSHRVGREGHKELFGTVAHFKTDKDGKWVLKYDYIKWSDFARGNIEDEAVMPYWWQSIVH